jgi:hypothetical protein
MARGELKGAPGGGEGVVETMPAKAAQACAPTFSVVSPRQTFFAATLAISACKWSGAIRHGVSRRKRRASAVKSSRKKSCGDHRCIDNASPGIAILSNERHAAGSAPGRVLRKPIQQLAPSRHRSPMRSSAIARPRSPPDSSAASSAMRSALGVRWSRDTIIFSLRSDPDATLEPAELNAPFRRDRLVRLPAKLDSLVRKIRPRHFPSGAQPSQCLTVHLRVRPPLAPGVTISGRGKFGLCQQKSYGANLFGWARWRGALQSEPAAWLTGRTRTSPARTPGSAPRPTTACSRRSSACGRPRPWRWRRP